MSSSARHLVDGDIDYAKRDAKILALADAGVSRDAIGERFGLSMNSVSSLLFRLRRDRNVKQSAKSATQILKQPIISV